MGQTKLLHKSESIIYMEHMFLLEIKESHGSWRKQTKRSFLVVPQALTIAPVSTRCSDIEVDISIAKYTHTRTVVTKKNKKNIHVLVSN